MDRERAEIEELLINEDVEGLIRMVKAQNGVIMSDLAKILDLLADTGEEKYIPLYEESIRHSGAVWVQKAAVAALCDTMGETTDTIALVRVLKMPTLTPALKLPLIERIEKRGDSEAIAGLIAIAIDHEQNIVVREFSVEAIGRIGSGSEIAKTLQKILEDQHIPQELRKTIQQNIKCIEEKTG